jgi:hypothetical protein
MNEQEIHAEMVKLVDVMKAKGLTKVGAQFTVRLHAESQLFLHSGSRDRGDNQGKFFAGDNKFSDAHEWIAGLKSGDGLRLEAFMTSLGRLIDQGREAGIEVTYVNPLVEMMKSLSHNILENRNA